ncbi:hypothetical protein ARMSODRAFT_370554 [Armillaria solidipes]|uniref:Heterokaryon incompatibility domain-containing protein n=1 Tax=Armillaria solidipes TaxID=1076256 RepID=A0A2H3B5I8_9AGAR|nr:hypothetical protein ARMSODRAFT_370554 [Armillaria solidipes]
MVRPTAVKGLVLGNIVALTPILGLAASVVYNVLQIPWGLVLFSFAMYLYFADQPLPSWFKRGCISVGTSFSALSHARVRRLFVEDPNVTAPCWFSRRNTDTFHRPAQILRILVLIILGPIYIYIPHAVYVQISNFASSSWAFELMSTPDAVLTAAPGGGSGVYAPTGFTPQWLLMAEIVDGAIALVKQVRWSEVIRNKGYTTLSYPMDSAKVLFSEAGLKVQDRPTEKRAFSLRDRKYIAERLLIEYCSATRNAGNRTEYIWLDEFCLSDERLPDDTPERSKELGRLPDIFRNASQVAVFCHTEGCDHSSISCVWGTRLFTVGEILHAASVIRLTRKRDQDDPSHPLITHAYREPARVFRERMQSKAALGNRWHLYSIMQHSANAGSVAWQNAIHALVVEAIIRNRQGGYEENMLGKALNGLLPRRARLEDLKGEDGWADLAWLLELNQGFYNAASLAAVCRLGDGSWLGPPIEPVAGNERLEPVVHTFPVGVPNKSGIKMPLSIIGSQTIGLRASLKRDPFGLYTNEDMTGLAGLSVCILVLVWSIGLSTIKRDPFLGIAIIWLGSISFAILEMLVGTIYLERDGWIFLSDKVWGHAPQQSLGEQDPKLAKLIKWGKRQLIPSWSLSDEKESNGTLVDLNSRVMVKVVVTGKPNAMIILAIHGSGVTSMLVDRKEELHELVRKVGMCNVPPYVLAQTVRSGTICVGVSSENKK